MTGILRVAEINNFRVYGMLDAKYSEYFGFTNTEVEKLLNESLVDIKLQNENLLVDKKLKEKQKYAVKMWYNGYVIGE